MNLLHQLPLSEQKKIAAWTACRPVQGLSPSDYRVDSYGTIIRWTDHGKQTEYGWEIDHVRPSALGGPDSLDNLRALHWRKNRELGGHVGNLLNALDALGPNPMTKPRGLFGSSANAFGILRKP